VTREDLLRELRALPEDEAATLLRELLERGPVEPIERDAWLTIVDRLIEQYRPAWERLAQR
jgi:hypothetical protein